MSVGLQLVSTGHELGQRAALKKVLDAAATEIVIVCPFIQLTAARWITEQFDRNKLSITLRTITSNPLSQPSNDPRALRYLSALGEVRWLTSLHAKVYMADTSVAFVTSANLSELALDTQTECGVLLQNDSKSMSATVTEIRSYVDRLWDHAIPFTDGQLEKMAACSPLWTTPHVQAFDHAGDMALNIDAIVDNRIALECFPERLAFRKRAEEEVLDIALRWQSVGPDSATPKEVRDFVSRFNADITPNSFEEKRNRFSGQLMGNVGRWSEHPSVFARWCTEFVFYDPADTFHRFWREKHGDLRGGAWFWSASLYLRKKEGFYIYSKKFAPSLEQAIGRPYSMPEPPTWRQYLGYCKLCSEFCSSRSIPLEFADLVLSAGASSKG